MEKKIIVGVSLASILVIVASFLLPGGQTPQSGQFLPWQITATDDGNISVFGLVPDRATLGEAEANFHHDAVVSLFASPRDKLRLEAYFDKVVLGGFSARLVLTLSLPVAELVGMQRRGIRVSSLGDGTRKITLSGPDRQQAQSAVISVITYLTRARLDAELLRRRFGEPALRRRDPEHDVVHWLYPRKGLDISIGREGHALLQYVSPARFDTLTRPLQQAQPPARDDT